MLFEFTLPIIEDADRAARARPDLAEVLPILRKMSLDNFAALLFSMPDKRWPFLSSVLPRMAASDVQKRWTGRDGHDLLRNTVPFARQIQNNLLRSGKDPSVCKIMDFGCGYGRFVRMLYYLTDPQNIWAVDAWQKSLDICNADGVKANFLKTDAVPQSIPVGHTKFDLAFAFSIFTHLSQKSAEAVLSAVRDVIASDGLFIVTIRPIEYWSYHDKAQGTEHTTTQIAKHNEGYAYVAGTEAEDYGLSSMPLSFFNRAGWKVIGHDTTLADPYQISALLQPDG